MSTRIPPAVRKKIFDRVHELADRHKYLQKGRNENARFLDSLVADREVGGRLREFMPEERVKSYVKDAILNKYAKKRKGLLRDVGHLLPAGAGEWYEVGTDREKTVSFHRAETGVLLAVARTTYIKWETGVRKLLLYVAGPPEQSRGKGGARPRLMLVIHEHGASVNESDKKLTERALELAGIDCAWIP
jgi:hypothetical protein